MNWISVKDRLPEDIEIDVMVKTSKGHIYQPYYYCPMSRCFITDVDSPYLPYSDEDMQDYITHWCEITDPNEDTNNPKQSDS